MARIANLLREHQASMPGLHTEPSGHVLAHFLATFYKINSSAAIGGAFGGEGLTLRVFA